MAIQCILVVVALACVPCMLIVKTLVMRRQHLWRRHLVRTCIRSSVTFFIAFKLFVALDKCNSPRLARK